MMKCTRPGPPWGRQSPYNIDLNCSRVLLIAGSLRLLDCDLARTWFEAALSVAPDRLDARRVKRPPSRLPRKNHDLDQQRRDNGAPPLQRLQFPSVL